MAGKNISATLPLSLLDLTFARLNLAVQTRSLSSRLRQSKFHSRNVSNFSRRWMNQLAPLEESHPEAFDLAHAPSMDIRDNTERRIGAFSPRPRGVMSRSKSKALRVARDLQERVDALVQIPVEELEDAEDSSPDVPYYSEEDLTEFYANLLAHPESSQGVSAADVEREAVAKSNADIVIDIGGRILEEETSLTDSHAEATFSGRLNAERRSLSEEDGVTQLLVDDSANHRQMEELPNLHLRLLTKLEKMVKDMEDVARIVLPQTDIVSEGQAMVESSNSASQDTTIPTPVLLEDEWHALVRYCLEQNDPLSAARTLHLLQRSNTSLPEPLINEVMAYNADRGDVQEIESLIQQIIPKKKNMTEKQIDLHIKSHLRSSEHGIPSALSLLHTYESFSPAVAYPPLSSYTRVINALLSTPPPTPPSNRYYTHAWDIFAHMQYVTGRKPDLSLYTLMISACSSTSGGGQLGSGNGAYVETQRALDLWTEMTVDRGLTPDVAAYNALIEVLARSSTNHNHASSSSSDANLTKAQKLKTDSYYSQAFLLARQMVTLSADAYGSTPSSSNDSTPEKRRMTPNKKTFKSLLVAAKRRGDLARARWILAEIVKLDSLSGGNGAEHVEKMLDDEVMFHVFHAYASYSVPFTRHIAPLVRTHVSASSAEKLEVKDGEETPLHESVEESSQLNSAQHDLTITNSNTTVINLTSTNDAETPKSESNTKPSFADDLPVVSEHKKYFTVTPPQSRSEVIGEINALFDRICFDNGISLTPGETDSKNSSLSHGAFSSVKLSSRLVNAYLAAQYAHADLSHCRSLYNDVFANLHSSGVLVGKNLKTYVDAIERCSRDSRKKRRVTGDGFLEKSDNEFFDYGIVIQQEWGKQIWEEWLEAMQAIESDGVDVNGVNITGAEKARTIEKMYVEKIRLCALMDRLDDALSYIDSFHNLYPPTALLPNHIKSPMQSTKFALYSSSRPLVRLSSSFKVVDTSTPPLLNFNSLKLLHQKLVFAGRTREVGKLKYICKSYESALIRRRNAMLQ